MEPKEIRTATLVPVSEWVYNRYRITYMASEDGPVLLTKHLVSTDNHLEGTIEQNWPSKFYTHYRWEVLEANVARPPQIGVIHGMPIHADGWER